MAKFDLHCNVKIYFIFGFLFWSTESYCANRPVKKPSSIISNNSNIFEAVTNNGSKIFCLKHKNKIISGKRRTLKNNKIEFTTYKSIITSQVNMLKKSKSKNYLKKIAQLKSKLLTLEQACNKAEDNPSNQPDNPNPGNENTPSPGPALSEKDNSLSYEEAQHLFRRAGFGGTPEEINLAVQTGLRSTIDRLLTVQSTLELDNEVIGLLDGDPEPQSPPDEISEYGLRLAFLTYMLKSPNQLKEKMAFFWHDLLAASARSLSKNSHHLVQDYLNILRENSLGNIRSILQKITVNGLMLRWLDGDKNKAGAVNENYAREFWELFTLERGNYTEKDISEAARAFTGWTLKWDDSTHRYEVAFVPSAVDNKSKVIFENTSFKQIGNFTGEDIVNITLDHNPAASRHFAKAIYKFLTKSEPSSAVVDILAQILKQSNFEITPAIKKILLSKEFFAVENRSNSVKTPIEFCIGLMRSSALPIYDIRYLERAIRDSGLTLLNPPSVKGWDDNEYWINDQWMINRASFVHSVLNEASPMDENFSLNYLLPSDTANSEQFLNSVVSRLGLKLNPEKTTNVNYYLNYIRQWNAQLEPWLFDPRHKENFESKARGLLFILAQDDSYQMN